MSRRFGTVPFISGMFVNVLVFQDCSPCGSLVEDKNETLTNIPLMKGTVPKRLDICYDFGTFSNILNFYFLIVLFDQDLKIRNRYFIDSEKYLIVEWNCATTRCDYHRMPTTIPRWKCGPNSCLRLKHRTVNVCEHA